MKEYFSYPLANEYTFYGQLMDEKYDNKFSGLIKYRPGYMTTLQLISNSLLKYEDVNLFYGTVFQDNQLANRCTLVVRGQQQPFGGWSAAGYKMNAFCKYILIGDHVDKSDLFNEYVYSTNLIQCFFAPNGSCFEEYSSGTLNFSFGEFSLEVSQHAYGVIINPSLGAKFISCSDEFKSELSELIDKHKSVDEVGPAIKENHEWYISINSDVDILNIERYERICDSFNKLLFILSGHQSSPLGICLYSHGSDNERRRFDMIMPVYVKHEFDKSFDGSKSGYWRENPINYKSIGEQEFRQIIDNWFEREEDYHFIIQTLSSNYTGKRGTHSAYQFARCIDALEAICELDRRHFSKQDKKIEYAISTYASEEIISFIDNKLSSDLPYYKVLAGERAKIVHPKSSHKEIWNEQKKYYNLSMAINLILHSYVQMKIGISPELAYRFQEVRIGYLLIV